MNFILYTGLTLAAFFCYGSYSLCNSLFYVSYDLLIFLSSFLFIIWFMFYNFVFLDQVNIHNKKRFLSISDILKS